ncbi:MAG: sodium:solute symporter, partial [Pseudomonadota bacterium]|nr:sodium:solute symporter [Pseudomonadota bacterium]
LLSRGLQAGVVIAAPAVILSIVLNLNLTITILAIGVPTTIYTMFGGVQAVTWTDVKQMVIIVAGLAAAIVGLVMGLPDEIGVGEALHVAGTTGRLLTLDFTFDLNETYTVWSGMIGGLFLMLGYFGCDQSQVQRYLTARSVTAGRQSLMLSAFAKIPLQALILLTGVLVFTFYLFNTPPMLFNTVHDQQMRSSSHMAEYEELNSNFLQAFNDRREAARAAAAARRMQDTTGVEAADALFQKRDLELGHIRDDAKALVIEVTGDRSYSDVNYVFPTFVTTQLPIGVVGLIIAAILAAAMSSIAAELNSLSTATVIDFYRRHFRREASDEHYMRISKMTTGFWGLTASIIAMYAVNLGTLIEVVNRFGSFFYGSLLGVFMLAILVRWATARGAFWGLIGGMTSVTAVALTSEISFLWLNVVGAIAVFLVGIAISAFQPSKKPASS